MTTIIRLPYEISLLRAPYLTYNPE